MPTQIFHKLNCSVDMATTTTNIRRGAMRGMKQKFKMYFFDKSSLAKYCIVESEAKNKQI